MNEGFDRILACVDGLKVSGDNVVQPFGARSNRLCDGFAAIGTA
jgi:hypothetical protein